MRAKATVAEEIKHFCCQKETVDLKHQQAKTAVLTLLRAGRLPQGFRVLFLHRN